MKKRIYFLTLLMAVSATFLFNSCKKEEDPAPKTKTELLTSKSWKLTSLTSVPAFPIPFDNGPWVNNIYKHFLDYCDKDNTYTFLKSGVFSLDQGLIKCDTINPQTTTQNWAFNSTQTVITFTDGISDPVNFNILSLNYYYFNASTIVNYNSKDYTWTYTWEKIN